MYSIPRRQSGATLVEMAIIAPVFLLVLIAIIELSMMFFATLTMQYAVREGGRFAITGRCSESGAANQQRFNTVIAKIRDSSMGMYDRTAPVISVNGTQYSTKTYGNAMFGAAGDILVIQLDSSWPVSTPMLSSFFTNGVYRFTVAATMRNEIFQSCKT
ncbi:TadE/TadG family type IV pilus assembly protein [Telluria beijingensis]|uniref:TadE/TadG family type IV pilus assembly protein n=1 Tax=Telluria beijingensis TaxID=3068633 RepID=UPI0027953EEA|nr:TadE family protein [Massilia sp. REN29]